MKKKGLTLTLQHVYMQARACQRVQYGAVIMQAGPVEAYMWWRSDVAGQNCTLQGAATTLAVAEGRLQHLIILTAVAKHNHLLIACVLYALRSGWGRRISAGRTAQGVADPTAVFAEPVDSIVTGAAGALESALLIAGVGWVGGHV